jgi:hypothetical protein
MAELAYRARLFPGYTSSWYIKVPDEDAAADDSSATDDITDGGGGGGSEITGTTTENMTVDTL